MLNKDDILRKMCQDELSDADIKAICKARGFPVSEAGSRSILENFLLSDTGLFSIFEKLNQTEIVFLHLLKHLSKPVPVSFFSRISQEKIKPYGTYQQRYNELFKQIRKNLIQKGIIFYAETRFFSYNSSKLERIQCVFPSEFYSFLPPIIKNPIKISSQAEWNEAAIRDKLSEIVTENKKLDNDAVKYFLHIEDKKLYLGENEFSIHVLKNWQQHEWATRFKPSLMYIIDSENFVTPFQTILYALSSLSPEEFVEPSELNFIFKIFCGDKCEIDSYEVLKAGWQTGCLLRQIANEKTFYRLGFDSVDTADNRHPSYYLDKKQDGSVWVDHRTIPFNAMERLAKVSFFKLTKEC